MTKRNLMPIGRFSKACRLSIKALRYYDDQGLLVPSYIDPVTNYRYYERHQARQAVMISMLRGLGLSLERIKELLQADSQRVREILLLEQQRLERELAKQRQSLDSIDRLVNAGALLPYEIGIRDEPDYTVACLTGESDIENMVSEGSRLIYELFAELQTFNRGFVDPVLCINEDPGKNDRIVIHGCIGIELPFPKLKSASIETLKGGKMAWLTHEGAYEELGLAYHALLAWAQERGHEQRAAMREIYLNDPAETPRAQLRTEVLLPVR